MRCWRVRHQLLRYQDGELSAEQTARMEAHLRGCEACAREYAELAGAVKLIESLPGIDPGPDFTSTVLEAVAAEAKRSAPAARPEPPAAQFAVGTLLGVAGLLLSAMVIAAAIIIGVAAVTGGAAALAPVTGAAAKTLSLGFDVCSVTANALALALGKPFVWLLISDLALLLLILATRKHLLGAGLRKRTPVVLTA